MLILYLIGCIVIFFLSLQVVLSGDLKEMQEEYKTTNSEVIVCIILSTLLSWLVIPLGFYLDWRDSE